MSKWKKKNNQVKNSDVFIFFLYLNEDPYQSQLVR